MEEKSVEVVLSGPIPYPSMTNIAFSRMYAFHDWVNQNLSGGARYVNNFNGFWDQPGLFLANGYRLNDKGIEALQRNILNLLQD